MVSGASLHTYVEHLLEEDLEYRADLFVDVARDTFDTTTASEAANVAFGDSLDVVPQDLPMMALELAIYP